MRTPRLAAIMIAGALWGGAIAVAGPAPKPNILIILADDMGFSDASCYGGEIATPNLDALAREGLRYTQFYNTARCWPSRAALLTGYYAQQVRRDTVPGIRSGAAGVRPEWAPLLPALLKPLGYHSYHSGKWHIDGRPLQNGFEHSYSVDDPDRYFAPRSVSLDGRTQPQPKPGSGYYATTAIAGHAVEWLRGHAADHPGEPFFEYLAFTSPHFPLQAPEEDIARCRGRYAAGWDALREARWERMRAMGLVSSPGSSALEPQVGPPYPYPEAVARLGPGEVSRPVPWKSLDEVQQRFQAEKMTIHAAMIERMDREIGRVLEQLRAMGAMDNTLIFFLSDNGASAEMMVRGDGHDPAAVPGSAGTFLSLGPGWSSLANTPFRRHKTWVHEGGIATPLIVHWPKGIAARGELRTVPGHLVDLVPTVLEAAGVPAGPAPAQGGAPAAPGRSLVASFAREEPVPREPIWWMHEGNRALRAGDWKIVAAGEAGEWELYDLSKDRTELHNLAAEMPWKVGELEGIWSSLCKTFQAQAREGARPDEPAGQR